MAKKTPASTENSEDSAQDLQQSVKKTVMPQADVAPQADSTLPFAQPRDELINKFRANAVPREADYKQLLDQHYDVAGALGMAHAEDNNDGAMTGNGLTFNTGSKKLEVLAKVQGGLLADAAGVQVVHNSSLTVGSEGLALNVDYHPTAATALVGAKGLTTNAQGQLSVSLNHNTGTETVVGAARAAGVIKADNGLSIHVGASSEQTRKGLKSYSGNSNGNVLGVDHDTTLRIDSTGKLGVNSTSLPVNTATVPLSVSGGKVAINTDSSLSVSNGKLGINTAGLPVNGAKVPLSVSNGKVAIDTDSTLIVTSGKLGIDTAGLPVNGVTLPLAVSGGKVYIVNNSTLSTTGGALGVNTTAIVPRGTIVMFSGSSIPTGWGICDGTTQNGLATPNLIGRFIRGGTTSTVRQTGGADSQSFKPTGTINVAGHKLTIDEMPSHKHKAFSHVTPNVTSGSIEAVEAQKKLAYSPQSLAVTCSDAGGDQAHNHSATFQGKDETIDTIPAYYTLIFIIKL